eukprot:GILI01005563.1.p1 GENE.GILI01005563.1~~GILI01005563.1.p1  ORF type:complete len:341 (+),score=55.79 GILI01005563.1:118-1140(+)
MASSQHTPSSLSSPSPSMSAARDNAMSHNMPSAPLSSGAVATAHSLAGATGALFAMAVVYPLDNLRTRCQVSRNKNSLEVLREVLNKEGWKGLYAGLRSTLLGVGASWATYYFFYAYFKRKLRVKGDDALRNLVIAMGAGALSAILTNPIWVVNTRMKLRQEKRNASMLSALQTLYKEEGLRGLFRGIGPSLILVVNPAIQFMVYEKLKRMLSRRGVTNVRRELTSLEYLLIGAISKAVATVATYPQQVVKSRLQARPEAGPAAVQYTNLLDCLMKIWRIEGPRGFFRGMSSKMVATVLTSGFMFLTYERLVQLMASMFTLAIHRKMPMVAYTNGKALAK